MYIVYINLELCNEGLEPYVRLLLRMWSDKSLCLISYVKKRKVHSAFKTSFIPVLSLPFVNRS